MRVRSVTICLTLLVAVSCIAFRPTPPVSTPIHPQVRRYLTIDKGLGETSPESWSTLEALERVSAACASLDSLDGDSTDCLVRAMFGEMGFRRADDDSTLGANTVTSALELRQGSCAALVATALLAASSADIPLRAVVWTHHVVLSNPGVSGRYYEVLEQGRVVQESDLARYGPPPPTGTTEVDVVGFLPFYLDNLAVRIGDAGDHEEASKLSGEALALREDGRFRFNLGTFLLRSHAPKRALEEFDRAIADGWETGDAWSNRGVALSRLGRLDDAVLAFVRALEVEPQNTVARRNLERIRQH